MTSRPIASLKASGELDNLPYDLKLTAFDSGAPVQEALNAGALYVGFTGDLPFLFVYAAGAPVKAVGAWQNNPDSIVLLTRPDAGIQSLQDLKGKQIAVNRGGWGHYLILGLLERTGLKPDDVTLRFLGPVDGRAALTSGAVAAREPWEPLYRHLNTGGWHGARAAGRRQRHYVRLLLCAGA